MCDVALLSFLALSVLIELINRLESTQPSLVFFSFGARHSAGDKSSRINITDAPKRVASHALFAVIE